MDADEYDDRPAYRIMPARFGWWGAPCNDFDDMHWHLTRRIAERCAARYFRRLDRAAAQGAQTVILRPDRGANHG